MIILIVLMATKLASVYAQLEMIKPGRWQMAQPPKSMDGSEAARNSLYTILQIKHQEDTILIQTATIRSDGKFGVEELILRLGEPFVGESPSRRKTISLLTYDKAFDRFKLERKYYTVADDTKLEFIMNEELWYDKKGYMHMTRVCNVFLPNFGMRNYDAKAYYALREE